MRILFAYGVVTGGGCERRMGDLVTWLNANGHEAWICASQGDSLGDAVVHGQCGVGIERVLYNLREDGSFHHQFMPDWVEECVQKNNIDLIDVQWYPGFDPGNWSAPAVATVHGAIMPPPAQHFRGVIQVEQGVVNPSDYACGAPHIWNWVNLGRFPFMPDLGDGMCHAGREFKAVNVGKVLWHYVGDICGYGTPCIPHLPFGKRWKWKGWADLADRLYRHRIVFAVAQTALEAMASGRWVLAGQTPHLPGMGDIRPEGCLITPDNVATLADVQFAYRRGYEPTSEEVWHEAQHALLTNGLAERQELRRWVEEHHNLDVQCDRIASYYREVIG